MWRMTDKDLWDTNETDCVIYIFQGIGTVVDYFEI